MYFKDFNLSFVAVKMLIIKILLSFKIFNMANKTYRASINTSNRDFKKSRFLGRKKRFFIDISCPKQTYAPFFPPFTLLLPISRP